MSDLHLEFEPPKSPGADWSRLTAARKTQPGHPSLGPDLRGISDADLVVLAGDIAQGTDGVAYADALASFANRPVVYVPGNHEYYNQDFDELGRKLRDAAWATDGRVILLDRGWTRLWLDDEQLLVLGCILWSDYALNGDPSTDMAYAAAHMNDHRRISREHNWFTPLDALAEHRKSIAWLSETLPKLRKQNPDAHILVVSHHAPCRAGLGRRAADLHPAYASDLEELIRRHQPEWWLHGHTHHRHATRIGKTLVASAPRGYFDGKGTAENFRYDMVTSDASDATG